MALDSVAPAAQRVLQWSAIALGASIPISTALDNVLLGIAALAWACSGQVRDTIKKYNKIKYLRISLLLMGLLAIGMLYGAAPLRAAFSTFGKYADLLWIAVFAVAFRDALTQTRALHAFAIAMVVVVVLSYLIRFGVIPSMPLFTGNAASPTVFKFKITHNFLAVMGAFLFVWLGHTCGKPRLRLMWYAAALLATANVLLMVQGATGYVTFALLLLLLGWERLGSRGLLYAVAALAAVVSALVITPTPFRERVALIQQEVQQWRIEDASQTSSGLRLEFYQNTLDMIRAQPLIGVGTGGFARAYALQVQGSGQVATQNPHNEFLHVTAQIGIFGLAALLALFWAQWRTVRDLESPMARSLTRALVLAMVAGCMVNSLLLDHVEGLFYAWLSGLLLGGLQYASPQTAPAST